MLPRMTLNNLPCFMTVLFVHRSTLITVDTGHGIG